MPDEFTISQLPTTPSFNNLDLMEIAQVDPLSVTGYSSFKKTMNQIGDKLNNSIEYSVDLNTTDKKIIGAINELNTKLSDLSVHDVKSQITWNESTASGTGVYRVGKMVFLTYQGASLAHSNGDTLFTIPSALRPIQNYEVSFVAADGSSIKATGFCHIYSSSGNCNVGGISDTSVSGRIYFSVAFPIA